MTVVSNTSPITNLAAIGQFALLRQVVGPIVIADAVWEELNAGGRPWPGSQEVAEAEWVERRSPRDRALVDALMADLDRGQSETLALAVELGADLVLLDEKEGRRMARRLGLRPFGVIGIVLAARQRDLVPAVHPLLASLRDQAGFHLTESVVQEVLRLAGEA